VEALPRELMFKDGKPADRVEGGPAEAYLKNKWNARVASL